MVFVILKSERNNYGVKMRLGHSLDRKNCLFFKFSWRFGKAGLAELVECLTAEQEVTSSISRAGPILD